MQQFGHLIYKEGQDNHPREYEILEVEGKTDYNYTEFLELDQRLLSYTKQIENFKTFTWEDKHNYQTIRLENIKSHFLDQNEEYQAMRNMITMFNNEMRDSERRNVKVRNGVWRFQFFTQLKQVIYDIEFFKKEREIQRLYVSKVYKWATEMLQKFDYQSRRLDSDNNPPKIPLKRPFSNQKRPQSALTIKTVRPYSGYPTTIDGQAETTIDQSLPDRPESAITGNIKFNDMKDSMFSKQPLPSDQIQEQLQDYKSKARTKHDNYEPPGTKLKQYKRRIIHNIPHRPVTSVQPVNKNQTFKKPPRSAVIPQIEEQEQEQIQDEEEVQEQENQEQIEQAIQLVKDQDKKTKEGFLDPLIKVFKNDDQLEDNFKRKLDFEKRDNYIVYETSKDQNEIKLQNYYQQKRQKEAVQKREDEEMITQMRHWSQNKARVDKEISRRIESAKVGNKFREMELKQQTDEEKDLKEMNKLYEKHKASFIKSQQERDLELSDLSDEGIEVDYETGQIDEGGERIRQRPQSSKPLQNHLVNIHPQLPKPQIQMKFYNNTDFRGLEEQIKNHNINKIKQLHGGLLQLVPQEDESSKLPPEQSMSVYGKNQNFAKKPRPFSAVIASYPIEQAQRDQIQEIEDIRIRLAQKDVYIPMNKLVKAMLVPEPHNDQDKEGKNLPQPGFGMLVDPFEKKKKKKAPRKKRSKK